MTVFFFFIGCLAHGRDAQGCAVVVDDGGEN